MRRKFFFYTLHCCNISVIFFFGCFFNSKTGSSEKYDANKYINQLELLNSGYAQLDEAKDGDIITVQGVLDTGFYCLDVSESQQSICTTNLTGNPSEQKTLVFRLKICNEQVKSNCVVWKLNGFCSEKNYLTVKTKSMIITDSQPIL
jgi:hypothetical protein